MDFEITFPALVAGRLLLAYAPFPDSLRHDQLLTSPLTSYPRCAVLSYGKGAHGLTSERLRSAGGHLPLSKRS